MRGHGRLAGKLGLVIGYDHAIDSRGGRGGRDWGASSGSRGSQCCSLIP